MLKNLKIARQSTAGVAKLVDAPDLGSGAARRGGSSPSTRTKFDNIIHFFNYRVSVSVFRFYRPKQSRKSRMVSHLLDRQIILATFHTEAFIEIVIQIRG